MKVMEHSLSVNGDGHLCIAGHDTTALAKKYGTPLYVMDEGQIRRRCRVYLDAMRSAFGDDALPLYASKALSCRRMYDIINDECLGADVVSSGELFTARAAGFPLEKVFFHGNNKTDEDIAFAIECGVGYFVCDNTEELVRIDCESKKHGVKQKILIRLTPGIDAHTNEKINTGRIDSKFGVAIETGAAHELTQKALALEHVELAGFHCHIGSQIFDREPFCLAVDIMTDFLADVKEKYGFVTPELNLGGGMAVRYLDTDAEADYKESILALGTHLRQRCSSLGIDVPRILMEPGRSIVADAGITLYTVGVKKEIEGVKTYVSIDGGMTDNPRFALYQAPYTVVCANRANDDCDGIYTVAGRCCESGDIIQENVSLPKVERGDILAVLATGAYNYAMSSNYNRLPRPALVMVDGERDYVAIRRESFLDLIKNDL